MCASRVNGGGGEGQHTGGILRSCDRHNLQHRHVVCLGQVIINVLTRIEWVLDWCKGMLRLSIGETAILHNIIDRSVD